MRITFFGHRSLILKDEYYKQVREIINEVITMNEEIEFLCGGYGDFDSVCAKVAIEIKKMYPNCQIQLVTPYILTSIQNKNFDRRNQNIYDGIIYPPIEHIPPRLAIIYRNKWMVENADFIIFYVKRESGGAYEMLKYAKKKNKNYINIAKEVDK